MQELTRLLAEHGLALVFAGVLLESLGAPVPAMLLLVVAGAYAGANALFGIEAFVLAMLACLIGEIAWFRAGMRYGARVLKTLCRIAIAPDSCVRQTENFYDRWGPRMLLVAKFVPGLSTLAAPLSGAMHLPARTFLLYTLGGAAIWVGASEALGYVFQAQIEIAGAYLARLGMVAVYAAAALFVLFLAFKWWERRRFFRTLRMARISVPDLRRLMQAGSKPVILDVRSTSARLLEPRSIPGAHLVDMESAERPLEHVARDTEVVVYCSCPNEASAARVAQYLMGHGFRRVRPLAGGLEAWLLEEEAQAAADRRIPETLAASPGVASPGS